MFKERLARKLVDQYASPYTIKEVVSTNTVKLQLPTSIRIHPVVNVSQIVQYKEQVGGQKKEEEKLIEIEGVKEWKIEKILNKKKIRGVEKYLVRWKGFTVEHDTWKKKEDLENTEEVLEEFKERINAEVKRQEKINMVKERNFRREELSGKFMAKIL